MIIHPRLDLMILEAFSNIKDSIIQRFTGSGWCFLTQVFLCGQHSKLVKVNGRSSELPSRNLRGEIHVLKIRFLQAFHRWNLFQVLQHFINYAQDTSKIFINVIFTLLNASQFLQKWIYDSFERIKDILQQGRRESVIAHLQKSLAELKCDTTNVFLFMGRKLTYLAVYGRYNIWNSLA